MKADDTMLKILTLMTDDTMFLSLNIIEDSDIDEDLDGGHPQQVDIQYSQTCSPALPPLFWTKIASGLDSNLDYMEQDTVR
jgi:hypothetical protein